MTTMPQTPPALSQGPTLLAAIEDGETAEGVMAMAIGHARAWPGSRLHLATVIDMPAIAAATFQRETRQLQQVADFERSEYRKLEGYAQLAHEALGDEVGVHLLVGPTTEELCCLATEIDADLLLVGTHDVGLFRRLLQGSVSAPLTRQAPCSVLLVRPKRTQAQTRAVQGALCADCLRLNGASYGAERRCLLHALGEIQPARPGQTSRESR